MASLAPRFSSVRMLQQYVEQVYLPAAGSFRARSEADGRLAEELVEWSRQLHAHWPAVRFGAVAARADAGGLTISVPVHLGAIPRESVQVQLYADADDGAGPVVQPMMPIEPASGQSDVTVYGATFSTSRPADHFTPRVVPYHPAAKIPMELPLIAWQR
jgi:starch phosphorylase